MKKTLLAVALTAAAVTASPAFADLKISGHANLKGGFLEDLQSEGVAGAGNEDLTIGDGQSSGSRFRIVSSTEANGITYGSKLEFGYDIEGLSNRVNEVSAGGSFGKVTLGKGSTAGDGATEVDYSGTYLTSGDLGTWEFGANLDGNNFKDPSRAERLRYDSPAIGNFSFAASIDDATANDTGNDVSVAATYELKNFKVTLASVSAEADDKDVMAGSVAGRMAGFTASLAYYVSENGAASNDLEQTRGILGYNVGKYSVAVDFGQTETEDKTIDAETAGLNFIYRPTGGVELYAGVRNAQANNGAIDENGFLFGTRVKF
jgi:hypothetical protein